MLLKYAFIRLKPSNYVNLIYRNVLILTANNKEEEKINEKGVGTKLKTFLVALELIVNRFVQGLSW